ncbi:hypothetical protein BJM39_05355 [Salmonella enterica subsp. enterica serovar Javiana]|nr:hypothetical protein BJM39_05355 [Salmonella enterica subsp. enterica serovar Javiana]
MPSAKLTVLFEALTALGVVVTTDSIPCTAGVARVQQSALGARAVTPRHATVVAADSHVNPPLGLGAPADRNPELTGLAVLPCALRDIAADSDVAWRQPRLVRTRRLRGLGRQGR